MAVPFGNPSCQTLCLAHHPVHNLHQCQKPFAPRLCTSQLCLALASYSVCSAFRYLFHASGSDGLSLRRCP